MKMTMIAEKVAENYRNTEQEQAREMKNFTDRLRRRVRRGAAKLDECIPDWFKKINAAQKIGRFDMGNWNHCVAGTLELVKRHDYHPDTGDYLGYGTPVIAFNGVQLVGEKEAAEYGFMPVLMGPSSSEGLDILQRLWLIEVNRRLETA
jgi:hypothetical protein